MDDSLDYSRIKAVIFDLGRVLVDVDFGGLLSELLPPERIDREQLDLEKIMQQPWFRAFSMGKMDRETFYRRVSGHFELELSREQFEQRWASVFAPRPEMEKIVRTLHGRIPLGLLSDTDPIHWEWLLNAYDFLALFKEPVLSFRIGAMKPSAVCYKLAAGAVKTPQQNCLFIDDRMINVQGARECGMQAVCFESAGQVEAIVKKINLG